ncbi:MAG: MBL fold metallo-hydrolase, partial [Clostridia bacterium]|nr:MBL fold metallo-hydrolase [Clostridia bacterium]
MRVCSFSSGSKGNCAYIETAQAKILIDVGVSLKYLLECFEKLKVDPREIDAVLVTHEHSDHIKGLESFCSKFDVEIFCSPVLYNVLSSQAVKCINLLNRYDSNFEIKDLKIFPFELSHDSSSCFGYKLVDDCGSASFVTDTGYLPDNAYSIIENSSLVFLESNYDPDMLYACSYPPFLKKRIMSNIGHLSNLDCAKIIERISKTKTRQVVLSHISENSNTPYLAFNTIKNYLDSKNIVIGEDIKININYQSKIN